jgi:hypothetical protein
VEHADGEPVAELGSLAAPPITRDLGARVLVPQPGEFS